MINTPDLADVFRREMLGTYDQAREFGYTATYFLRMLQQYGAVDAAKRLLATQEIQQGLMELCLLGHLEISMEAIVVKEQFKSLFTEAEVAEAHRRLEKLGYFRHH